MRILVLSWEYPPVVYGGLGRHVHALSEALARAGHVDAAIAILADVTAADAPPPYDTLVMNPFLKRLVDDPRTREIVDRSRTRHRQLLEAISLARAAGRFPRYLQQPLRDLQSTLRDSR